MKIPFTNIDLPEIDGIAPWLVFLPFIIAGITALRIQIKNHGKRKVLLVSYCIGSAILGLTMVGLGLEGTALLFPA